MKIITFLSPIQQIMSLWAYYVPGAVPGTGDTDNSKSSRDAMQGKQIRIQ